jgi:hypothetical protein
MDILAKTYSMNISENKYWYQLNNWEGGEGMFAKEVEKNGRSAQRKIKAKWKFKGSNKSKL